MTVRTSTLKIKIHIEADAKFRRVEAAVGALVKDPAIIIKMLRAAIQETLLVAYARRFAARTPQMRDMQRFPNASALGATAPDGVVDNPTRQAAKFARDLEAAVLAGDQQEIARVTALQSEVSTVADPTSSDAAAGPVDRSGPSFTTLMAQVIDLITDEQRIGIVKGSGSILFGIGEIPALNDLDPTPSWAAGGSKSAFNVMWRHLEFGTGVYSKLPSANSDSKYSETDGSWWFGKKRGQGLHLRGSLPGNFLRTTSGLPYEADAIRFDNVFGAKLKQYLRGA